MRRLAVAAAVALLGAGADASARVVGGTLAAAPGHEAFPSAELAAGSLVVSYRSGGAHISADGGVVMARSRDARHWTARTVFDDAGDDRANLGLTELGSGTLLQPMYEHDGTTLTAAWTLRSRDGGRTWTRRRPIRPPGVTLRGLYGRALERGPRTLLLPAYGYTSPAGRESSVLLRSRDRGRSWALHSVLGAGLNEASILALGAEGYLAVVRGHGETGVEQLSELRSHDGGRTWSAPRVLFHGVSPDLVRLRSGRRLLCLGVRDAEPGLRCHRSRRGGGWLRGTTLYRGGAWDLGYPSSVVLPGGAIFTAFYDDRNDIAWRAYCEHDLRGGMLSPPRPPRARRLRDLAGCDGRR